jgi:cytoskeletal protein CcmA (bactofilin family)
MLGQRLTIAPSGRVRRNVTAREIDVHGCFAGQAEATDKVHIRAGAEIVGDIFAGSIVILDGAFIKGNVELSLADNNTDKSSATMGST